MYHPALEAVGTVNNHQYVPLGPHNGVLYLEKYRDKRKMLFEENNPSTSVNPYTKQANPFGYTLPHHMVAVDATELRYYFPFFYEAALDAFLDNADFDFVFTEPISEETEKHVVVYTGTIGKTAMALVDADYFFDELPVYFDEDVDRVLLLYTTFASENEFIEYMKEEVNFQLISDYGKLKALDEDVRLSIIGIDRVVELEDEELLYTICRETILIEDLLNNAKEDENYANLLIWNVTDYHTNHIITK